MAVFVTDEKLTFWDIKTEEVNIFDLLSLGEQYILKNIHWHVEIDGTERKEVPEIQIQVIIQQFCPRTLSCQYGS